MKAFLNCLPRGVNNAACCDFIENAPLSSWLPALDHLRREFGLADGPWQKIPQGSNALFGLGGDVIVKLVPSNWRRQGDKEILVAPLLEGKLSLQTPGLIGSGEIDDWVFVISTRLDGVVLADVWPTLAIEQKRAIMLQTGQVLRELRAVAFDDDIAIKVDWPSYVQGLVDGCLARHQRRMMPEGLLDQVLPYIAAAQDYTQQGTLRFIHMDIHPWNLMAKQEEGGWKLTGLLDFGDAIVGNSDRFELLTPMIFMAQGSPVLLQALLESYGATGDVSPSTLQRQLTACMLVRPDSDVMFCMQQVPVSGPRDSWEQIATQIFPIAA
ncbi:phosphotransferase family protein [Duganella sp. S19_KUP01_CR8]|uniref:phosphotransferase family protein n=1 Tax=Duganella sp. S19_KUP01_CR8 TaxID=3025502 RepID=UPI002FCDBE35